MRNFLTFGSGVTFRRFDIRIQATQSTLFEAWPGAVLRNNLLFAAAQVSVPEQGMTLFEYGCRQLPLSVSHPLYREIERGFPPPFYLYTLADRSVNGLYGLQKNEMLTFSLVLIGACSRYVSCFVQAIQYMCRRGMGVDLKPFSLIDVLEVTAGDERCILFSGNETASGAVARHRFRPDEQKKGTTVRVVFETPVSLIKQGRVSEKAGYQEKSNGFPGFYQLVRSAAYRMEKLSALYHAPDDTEGYIASHQEIEPYIEGAASGIWLEEACLRRETYQSTRKEGTGKRLLFTGYTGEVTFRGNYAPYLPLLRYIEQLGVGEKLSYGFGKIRVEEIPAQQTKEVWKKKEIYG